MVLSNDFKPYKQIYYSVGYSVGFSVGFSVGRSTRSRNYPAIGGRKERMGRLSRLARHTSRFCSRIRRFVRDRRGDMGFHVRAGCWQITTAIVFCLSMPSSVTTTEARAMTLFSAKCWNGCLGVCRIPIWLVALGYAEQQLAQGAVGRSGGSLGSV